MEKENEIKQKKLKVYFYESGRIGKKLNFNLISKLDWQIKTKSSREIQDKVLCNIRFELRDQLMIKIGDQLKDKIYFHEKK